MILQASAGTDVNEIYDGTYIVTPKIVEQTLYTAGKQMTDDVTVLAIPFYSVDNQQNGQTVIIGAE